MPPSSEEMRHRVPVRMASTCMPCSCVRQSCSSTKLPQPHILYSTSAGRPESGRVGLPPTTPPTAASTTASVALALSRSICFRLRDSRGVRDCLPFLPSRPRCGVSAPPRSNPSPILLSCNKAPVLKLVATPPPLLVPPGACPPPPPSLASLLISARASFNSFLSEAFSSLSAAISAAIAAAAATSPLPAKEVASPPDSVAAISADMNPHDDGSPSSGPSLASASFRSSCSWPCLFRVLAGETPPPPTPPRPAGEPVGTGVAGRRRDSNRADNPGFIVVIAFCKRTLAAESGVAQECCTMLRDQH